MALAPSDRRTIARRRAEGANRGRVVALPRDARFSDGSVHRHLRQRGYNGSFKVSTSDSGERVAELVDFDQPSAWAPTGTVV